MGAMQRPSIDALLRSASKGYSEAAEELLPLVYDQLRQAAQLQLASEREGHTLSATAIVHEAYLRLVGPREIPWSGRAHFYAAAAQAMRRILIDHARAKAARGGVGARLEDIGDVGTLASARSEQILAVESALVRLEAEDPEAATIVRFRFFAGLSVEETALALGVSPRTAGRMWSYARAKLFRELSEDNGWTR